MSKYAFRGDVDQGDSRTYSEWQKVAEDEGHTTRNSKYPNGYVAAKNYSKGGKRTTLVNDLRHGEKKIWEDGKKVYRDKPYIKGYHG